VTVQEFVALVLAALGAGWFASHKKKAGKTNGLSESLKPSS